MTGRVVKAVAGQFYVRSDHGVSLCKSKGILKRGDRLEVGDLVEFSDNLITKIQPRRNRLIRPSVANVDTICAVLAPLPEPDLMLADKLIIYADRLGIPVVLALNKSDLHDGAWADELTRQYAGAVRAVCPVSTVTGAGIEALKSECKGLTVLAGQSAVGKSSLLNCLGGSPFMETGEVAERSGRGRHTTRHAEIFEIDARTALIDTPGFSMLEGSELEMDYDDCDYYYTELFARSGECKYNRCTHTHEPFCAVKRAAESGEISLARYERYQKLRAELKLAKDTKY